MWAGFDVKTAVSSMVEGSIDNNGFMIITDSPRALFESTDNWVGGTWSGWASSDNSTVENRPKLTITYNDGTAENAAPVVANPTADLNGKEDVLFSYTLPSDLFTDIDGDPLTITVSGLPTGISLSEGTLSGTPTEFGTFTVRLTAADPSDETVSDEFPAPSSA